MPTIVIVVEPVVSATSNSGALNQPKSSLSLLGSNVSGVLVPYFQAMTVVVPVWPDGGAPLPAAVGQTLVPATGTPWSLIWESGIEAKPSCLYSESSRAWAKWKTKFVAFSWLLVTPLRISAWPVPALPRMTPSGLSVR